MKRIICLCVTYVLVSSGCKETENKDNVKLVQSDSLKIENKLKSDVPDCVSKLKIKCDSISYEPSELTRNLSCKLNHLNYELRSVREKKEPFKTNSLYLLKGFHKSNIELCGGYQKIVNFNFYKKNLRILIQEWLYTNEKEAASCFNANKELFIRKEFPVSRAQLKGNIIYYLEADNQNETRELIEVDSVISAL